MLLLNGRYLTDQMNHMYVKAYLSMFVNVGITPVCSLLNNNAMWVIGGKCVLVCAHGHYEPCIYLNILLYSDNWTLFVDF
jgi:hypothetical protein